MIKNVSTSGNAMARAIWMTGDFAAFWPYTQAADDDVFARAHVQPGERVLDAACGAGAFALRAARAGAQVTGIDIATNLIATARAKAAAESLAVRFDEGDVESLPYDATTFDTVVSQFGVIFAPQAERVVTELARVLKPSGRVLLYCWTPDSWVGKLMQTIGRHVPGPAPAPSPLFWGDEATARSRLAPHFTIRRVARGAYTMQFPFGPIPALDFFLQNMGPVAMAYAAFPEGPGKQTLRDDLENLFAVTNQGGRDNWATTSDYLQIEGSKK